MFNLWIQEDNKESGLNLSQLERSPIVFDEAGNSVQEIPMYIVKTVSFLNDSSFVGIFLSLLCTK